MMGAGFITAVSSKIEIKAEQGKYSEIEELLEEVEWELERFRRTVGMHDETAN